MFEILTFQLQGRHTRERAAQVQNRRLHTRIPGQCERVLRKYGRH